MLTRVVFLDRDGVINKNSPLYINSWDEFEFIPGSIDAITRLTAAGFQLIVITNQSGVGREMLTETELHRIFRNMRRAVEAAGGCITDIFYCPHHPEDDCDCRKPRPGLIRRAAEKYAIDLSSACMVGDNASDITCARAAGCDCAILVKSGASADAEDELAAMNLAPDLVAADLAEAADWIIRHFPPQADAAPPSSAGSAP